VSDEEKEVWTMAVARGEEEDPIASVKKDKLPHFHDDIPRPPLPTSPCVSFSTPS
jgi:hypothetical protein